jgi:L-Ala-D/L-Glu epimerase
MKILDLSLYIVELPFRFAFNHNLAKRSSSHNLIVKATIETEKGISTGYGEGIPREYVTGETIEQSIRYLNEKYFPKFKNKEFSNTADLVSYIIEQFHFFGLEERANGASWCALELALLDAAGHAQNTSIGQLLNPNNSPLATSVRYGATASLTNKKLLSGLLVFFKAYGFSTVKLKLGKNIDDAIERIKLARKIMGRATTLRVDANCAWSVSETISFAHKSQAYEIASIEQPIAADNIEGIAHLASSIPQAIVLDESVCTIQQAKYFIDNGIKIDFNIRISKMGGLLAAGIIKNLAKEAGISCHLGAQVGESGILTSAGRIFALYNGPFINHEGSANNLLLKYDLTKENLTFGYGGFGKLPDGPLKTGLGITIDQKKFNRVINNQLTMINMSSHLSTNSSKQEQNSNFYEMEVGRKR